jgi:hypothetical protein
MRGRARLARLSRRGGPSGPYWPIFVGWLALQAACAQTAGAVVCQPADNLADCGALGDLYAATGGTTWVGLPQNDGWRLLAAGGAPDVCTPGAFSGVTCDSAGRVNSM